MQIILHASAQGVKRLTFCQRPVMLTISYQRLLYDWGQDVIHGIHHVQMTIPVGLESEARDFYCHFLGIDEIAKPESLQGRGGFWLRAGAVDVHVGTETGVDRHATKAHIAWLVDDLNALRERLAERGIATESGIPIPGYDRFEFRDPFGNRVEFIQEMV